jgi:hypothetical protein
MPKRTDTRTSRKAPSSGASPPRGAKHIKSSPSNASMDNNANGTHVADKAAILKWRDEKRKEEFDSTPDVPEKTVSKRELNRQIRAILDRLIENATADGKRFLVPWIREIRSGNRRAKLRDHISRMEHGVERHIDPELERQRVTKPKKIYVALVEFLVNQLASNPDLRLSQEATSAVFKLIRARHDKVQRAILAAAARLS